MKIKDLIFRIDERNSENILKYLVEKSQINSSKTFVVSINPEIVMLAVGDTSYEEVLMSSDLALADGVGVLWAAKIFGKKLNGRFHGVDLVQELCREVSKKPITVGFLGGKENVAQETAECLKKKYPGLNVGFALEEWPEDSRAEVASKNLLGLASLRSRPSKISTSSPRSKIINHPSCDILFVAFGSPKQELWIKENLSKLNVRVVMGVGGAFDFISGRVPRAPLILRRLGLEWLFRLLIQPWRIKRQFALVKFVVFVLKEKFFYY